MAVDVLPIASFETSSQNLYRQRRRAVCVAALIVFAFTGWLALEIPKGILAQTDELLTAERTREMLLTNPWVVHYNFERSFEKPPLQYWLSMLTLPRIENRSIAVRIWPLVYASLTAIVLGWLAFLVEPTRPWLIPLSVAILVSCPLFPTEASRAMLDIGLTFFTTLAIVFSELARKRPAWWLAIAVACWLASLQKVPLPFLVWVLIVLVRLTSRGERAALRSGMSWLIGSMLLAIAAMSIWPLVQLLKYEMPVWSLFHEEVVVWLGPEGLGRRPYFEVPLGLSLAGGVGGFLLLLAPFVILFSKKEKPPPAVREIAIVSLAVIALTIVSNFRGVRYILPILPCLCCLLALFFCRFLEQGSVVRRRTIIALVVLLSAGFVQAKLKIVLRQKDVADEKVIAEKLGAMQQPGTKIVLIKAIHPGGDLIWDSFYLFHGNFRFPLASYTVDEIRRDPPKPPLIGACVARDFSVVREVYPTVQVQFVRAQFICWQVGD
jgi:4-amino-4-deoxy-L-arabinose transferase-like glycosyltransferase